MTVMSIAISMLNDTKNTANAQYMCQLPKLGLFDLSFHGLFKDDTEIAISILNDIKNGCREYSKCSIHV